MTIAEVKLWGKRIGAIDWDKKREVANFEYDPDFAQSSINLAPIMMPLKRGSYSFPANRNETFLGLPGMLADSLPDRFGNALIDAYLARVGRAKNNFNVVERLCYVGKRGMGALEYEPATDLKEVGNEPLEINELVQLASDILSKRGELHTSFDTPERERAIQTILRVGSSAGGARAKALIAYNQATNEVRSGQLDDLPANFSFWLLKFDGVEENRDKELNDPQGYGLIEYAYHKMAVACGIEMSECLLMPENGRNHFMTRRFDRTEAGKKLHMQSMCALGHYDFNLPGAYSYEQALRLIRDLALPMDAIEQQFRRMIFNIVARNQDDHTKNIAFLMDKSGNWKLAPAYDMTYSYNPNGTYTNFHQMTMNGKRDNFDICDFEDCGQVALLKRGRSRAIVDEIQSIVSNWQNFAADVGVPEDLAKKIGKNHRLKLT